MPGFENAYLLEIAPQVGIRETRRLLGQAVLTGEQVLGCADFDDTVGVNGWPLEQHVAGDVKWSPEEPVAVGERAQAKCHQADVRDCGRQWTERQLCEVKLTLTSRP
jgi:hypothetical protein